MRAVIDTNILVRAMLKPAGTVAPVLDLLRRGRYVYLYSLETLGEALEVLQRPRMVKKYGLTSERVEALRDLLVLHGECIEPRRKITVCRDADDDAFLEVAVAGAADVIVTGDEDLRVLDPFEGIPIIEPRRFVELLGD
ncbi:MAG: putative toxin-antitoxin system toxin component, PIN family [bacterium]|nr:putative toxin-antitoxin system toxin component, PIN family [bacterium]